VQTETRLVWELLLLSVAVAVVIGVIKGAKIPDLLRLVFSQEPMVVLVVVLVVDFSILSVAMLQLKLCLLVQFHMATRVVMRSAELTTTALAVAAQVRLV
jgi:hypothetical protein